MQEINNDEITKTLAQEFIKEKKADRRWKNIRFFAWFLLFVYFFISIGHMLSGTGNTPMTGKYVSLIRIEGMIAPDRDASAEELLPILRKAFKDPDAAGVVISINSPGGTPVQASIIHDAILDMKKRYNKRVIIVGEDLMTSGAYYVAVAADKIYTNPNTLTGSIGVIMKSFGFVDLMKKIGVERRVYTAGNDKDRLDPFLPQTPSDTQKIQSVMSEIHQNFVQAVLEGRKGKLQGDTSQFFTGDFWSGQDALKYGLIDGLGNLTDVMRKEFNTTSYKEYNRSPNVLRFLGGKINNLLDGLAFN